VSCRQNWFRVLAALAGEVLRSELGCRGVSEAGCRVEWNALQTDGAVGNMTKEKCRLLRCLYKPSLEPRGSGAAKTSGGSVKRWLAWRMGRYGQAGHERGTGRVRRAGHDGRGIYDTSLAYIPASGNFRFWVSNNFKCTGFAT